MLIVCSECHKPVDFDGARLFGTGPDTIVETECCNGSAIDADTGEDRSQEVIEAYEEDALNDAAEYEILRREEK